MSSAEASLAAGLEDDGSRTGGLLLELAVVRFSTDGLLPLADRPSRLRGVVDALPSPKCLRDAERPRDASDCVEFWRAVWLTPREGCTGSSSSDDASSSIKASDNPTTRVPFFADAGREVFDDPLLGSYSFSVQAAPNASMPGEPLERAASTVDFGVSGLADATREDLGDVVGRADACREAACEFDPDAAGD